MDHGDNSFHISQNFDPSQPYHPSFGNQSSQTTSGNTSNIPWKTHEDIALMSAYCFISTNAIVGTNQKDAQLWKRIHAMFKASDGIQLERTEDSLRQQYIRLNRNVTKWIGAYQKAWKRAKSGESYEDIEKDAQVIYGKKFTHRDVFNQVMCSNPKWEMKLERGSIREQPDDDSIEESHDSSKRSRTEEGGDFETDSTPETNTSDASILHRPTGRDQAKATARRRGKGVASQSYSLPLKPTLLKEMSSSFNMDDYSFDDDDQWEESIAEQNHQLDRIIEDVAIQATTLSLQPTNHNIRARRRYIDRIREKGHDSVFEQYFAENPVYPDDYFRTRYRMRKPLFLRIMNKLVETDEFFQQKPDAAGRLGMSAIQKCTAAMRVLAYGTSADLHDEYLRMSAQLIRKSVIKFAEGVIFNFKDEYLRKPTEEDTAILLHVGEQRGFPGMLGSIDCMHWKWKNCLSAWAGQYTGRGGKPTIILEAVASHDLWIWHAFFGTPGSRNDINVLDHSPVFDDILEGRAPKVNYVINGHERNMGYYLTDGIYPQWAAFVKSITAPQIRKHQLFAQHQEAVRKDVERAFGVLQARFAFIKAPCLIWDRDIMGKIMIACIIMHNMIVEDERNTYLNYQDPTEFIEDRRRQRNREESTEEESDEFLYSTDRIASLKSYMKTKSQLQNREGHKLLLDDLIEHISHKFDNHV